MEKIIYIRLLEDGTKVYRPVPAFRIEDNLYLVRGGEIYDREDELWEFKPGTLVLVEEQNFEGENLLVAKRQKITQ